MSNPSKREASEYITKEHGSIQNPGGLDSKPIMATAAQMARRKLATPKSRAGGRPHTPTTSASNPFANQTYQPVGGITFGASQNNTSFPPGVSAPGDGGFTFSAGQTTTNPFANTLSSSNPFASLNGTAPSGSINGVFGGNSVNSGKRSSDDMMEESPEKKPHSNLFGQPNNWSGPQQPGTLFGSGDTTRKDSTSNAGLFGSVSKPDQPKTGLFGQTSSSLPAFGGFGSNTQTTQPSPSFSFGQSQQKEQTPTPPPSFGASFGQPPTSSSSDTPNFPFGIAPTVQKPDDFSNSNENSRPTSPFKLDNGSAASSTPSGNVFAGIQAPAPAPKFTFGQTSSASPLKTGEVSSTVSQPPAGLFGQTNAALPSSTLFGASAEPAKTQPSTFNAGSFLSRVPEDSPQTTPTNIFGAPFGTAPPAQPPNGLVTTAAESQQAPLFNFGGRSTPTTSNVFAQPTATKPASSGLFNFAGPNNDSEVSKEPGKASLVDKSQEKSSQGMTPVFSFGNTQTPSSGGLFTSGRAATSDNTPATDQSKTPVFGGGSTLFQEAQAQAQDSEPATEKTKKRLFGHTLDHDSTSSHSAPPAPASEAPLFGAPSASKPVAPAKKPSANLFNPPPAPESANRQASSAVAQNLTTTAPTPQRPVYTKSPNRVPTFLNGEGYKEFDNNYRLRALNREFQRRVAAIDPSHSDFENIIRHYVAARASIGADIGLYQRTMAGTKRKNDTVDDDEFEVPQQYKKVKGSTGQPSATSAPLQPQQQADRSSTDLTNHPHLSQESNLFGATSQSVNQTNGFGKTAQPVKSSNVFGNNPSATKDHAASSSTSNATSMLNDMIPKSPSKTDSSDKATSVFASGSAPSTHSSFIRSVVDEIDGSPSKSATLGQPNSSTTPTKSPTKPMSANPGVFTGNAFAAFGNAASESAAAHSAELKAKQLQDYSSDEDSQAEAKKELAEADRAKRAKYASIPKTGFIPTFGVTPAPKPVSPAKSSLSKARRHSPFEPDSDEDEADDEDTTEEKDADFVPDGEQEESTEDSQAEEAEEHEEEEILEEEDEEDADDDDVDRQAEIDANPNAGKSLFERIQPNPDKETPVNGDSNESKNIESGLKVPKGEDAIMSSSTKNPSLQPIIWGAQIGKSTPDAPAFSPFTPVTSTPTPYKRATTFNFNPTPPSTTPTPTPGASVLSGGTASGSYAKFDGMFGSRPSTPNPTEKEANTPKSGPVNHTWTAGSPIRFEKGPNINITGPSPEKDSSKTPKAALSGLFGTTPASASTSQSEDAPVTFSFGSKPLPGYLGANKGLAPESGLSSGLSSRGTSPGLTDNESVATNDTDGEVEADLQQSFVDSRAGEENEDCLFEARSKALLFISQAAATGRFKGLENTWQTLGQGVIRLLKNKETGKARIIFRVEPGGNVIVNANLIPSMEYVSVEQGKSGAVKGGLFNAEKGWLERWVFKLKTKEMAGTLEGLLMREKNF